jgi:hypothetical protein
MNLLTAFFQTEAGLAVQGVLVVALVDFLLGVMAAFRDGTFALDAVAAWLRKHVAGRVGPIAALLFVGHFGAQPLLVVTGLGAAGLYVAETIGSIKASWASNRVQSVPED